MSPLCWKINRYFKPTNSRCSIPVWVLAIPARGESVFSSIDALSRVGVGRPPSFPPKGHQTLKNRASGFNKADIRPQQRVNRTKDYRCILQKGWHKAPKKSSYNPPHTHTHNGRADRRTKSKMRVSGLNSTLVLYIFFYFRRQLYSKRLIYNEAQSSEQMGLSQGSNSGNLVVVRLEPVTFWFIAQ